MNELKIFENNEFGKVRGMIINDKPYVVASDVAKALGYAKPNNAISTHCRATLKWGIIDSLGRNQETNMIPESDIYRLIFGSKLELAVKYQDWVFEEVLPQIRQTGGYIPTEPEDTPEELMARALIIANKTLELKEQRIKELEISNKKLTTEVIHKEDIIVGLVDDIDLETKRQRINQIIRYGANGRYSERWSLLYKEFSGKYHIDLKRRMESEDVKAIKPKIKSKMDYIDRVLNMTPQLYEVACKVFENEIEKLREEWESTIQREF